MLAFPLNPQAYGPDLSRDRSDAVLLLQIYAIALMVIPSDEVIQAVGAEGYAAAVVGLLMFGAWCMATLFGHHNPLEHRYPVRTGIVALWLVSLISYTLMHLHERAAMEVLGGDRWLIKLAALTGVVLVAAECLNSVLELRRVVRAIVWGGAIAGMVAAVQYWVNVDLAVYARMVPGFSRNGYNVAISSRAAVSRVSGTAVHPIELGVVAGMLLPLAIHLAIYDRLTSAWKRWGPVASISVAIPVTVSRSAVLSVVVAAGVFVVLLPAAQRVIALAAAPFALGAVFITAPGLISTLSSFFAAGTSDPSVAQRVQNQAFVEQMVSRSPWFGQGGGSWFPSDLTQVLDNEYLLTAIGLGLVGVAVLGILYFLLPAFIALAARRRTEDPELGSLTAALAGAAFAATLCSLTFDSLSFPMFAGVHALVIGMIGACWKLTSGVSGISRAHPLPGFVPSRVKAS